MADIQAPVGNVSHGIYIFHRDPEEGEDDTQHHILITCNWCYEEDEYIFFNGVQEEASNADCNWLEMAIIHLNKKHPSELFRSTPR